MGELYWQKEISRKKSTCRKDYTGQAFCKRTRKINQGFKKYKKG